MLSVHFNIPQITISYPTCINNISRAPTYTHFCLGLIAAQAQKAPTGGPLRFPTAPRHGRSTAAITAPHPLTLRYTRPLADPSPASKSRMSLIRIDAHGPVSHAVRNLCPAQDSLLYSIKTASSPLLASCYSSFPSLLPFGFVPASYISTSPTASCGFLPVQRLTSAMAELPSNVHVSQHPSLLAKLSQLRSKTASPRDVKSLVHEIALILSCEAVSSAIKPASGPKVAQVSSTVSSCTLTQSRT